MELVTENHSPECETQDGAHVDGTYCCDAYAVNYIWGSNE